MSLWTAIKEFFIDDRSIKDQFKAMVEAEEAARATPTPVNDGITDSVTAKPKRTRKPKAEGTTKRAPRKKK